MRIKTPPRRQIRTMSIKQFNDVTCTSENLNVTPWEHSSKLSSSSGIFSPQINKGKKGMWEEALDLTVAGPSSCCYHCWTDNDQCLPLDYTAQTLSQTEPIDLSMKTLSKCPPAPLPPAAKQSREFKDTFLYKMLTDPLFVENLKVTKTNAIFSCPFCKKTFPDEESFEAHQKSLVTETNRIACCACNKTFTQKRYLRYHQRSHSDRSKFTCDICTKKYSRQDNLTRHNTFHTNPDKFPCTYCERTFSRKDLLNKHVKGHENRFRYCCHICDKYFKGPLSLENHQKNHHKLGSAEA